MFNNWSGALVTAQSAGAAVANTATATSLLPSGAQFNFPSNYMNLGTRFRVKSSGVVSTMATNAATLTLDFRVGGTVVHSLLSAAALVSSLTNVAWKWVMECTLRSIGNGTAATLVCESTLFSAALAAATPLQLQADSVGTGFNATGSNYFDHYATWSVANASNSITLQQFCVEMLN